MHGKRLTAYKKIGFTNPVIGEIPLFPGTEMAAPTPARPSEPAAVSAAEVRTWAKENGLDVSARGRLRPEIWDQYRVAHLTAGLSFLTLAESNKVCAITLARRAVVTHKFRSVVRGGFRSCAP